MKSLKSKRSNEEWTRSSVLLQKSQSPEFRKSLAQHNELNTCNVCKMPENIVKVLAKKNEFLKKKLNELTLENKDLMNLISIKDSMIKRMDKQYKETVSNLEENYKSQMKSLKENLKLNLGQEQTQNFQDLCIDLGHCLDFIEEKSTKYSKEIDKLKLIIKKMVSETCDHTDNIILKLEHLERTIIELSEIGNKNKLQVPLFNSLEDRFSFIIKAVNKINEQINKYYAEQYEYCKLQ